MNEGWIIAALGLGVLWYVKRRGESRDALASKALDVAASAKPQIAISNVEAIEERQVWVFQPSVDPLVRWRTGGSATGPVVDVRAAFDSLNPKQKSGTYIEGKTLRLVDLGESGYNVLGYMDLYPGGFYDAIPRMGTLPFSDLRLEFVGTQYYAKSSPVDFRWTCLVPDDVWAKWWSTRIATVAEQVEAGGVVPVPSTLK